MGIKCEQLDTSSISDIVGRAIDQAIVNGEVDGYDRRVSPETLAQTAFMGVVVDLDAILQFHENLANDERFLGNVDGMLGYQAVVREGSQARPSFVSIIKGNALCTDREAEIAFDRMAYFANTVYTKANGESVLTVRQISGILRSATTEDRFSEDQLKAFMIYIENDDRFHVTGDGRVVLVHIHPGRTDEFKEPEPIADIQAAIDTTVDYIRAGKLKKFTKGDFLARLNHNGVFIPRRQVADMMELLKRTPGIMHIHGDLFKLVNTGTPRPTHTSATTSTKKTATKHAPGTSRSPTQTDREKQVLQDIRDIRSRGTKPRHKR